MVSAIGVDFAEAIDRFILYLATERGLPENYQLSTKRSLEKFADWAGKTKQLSSPRAVELGPAGSREPLPAQPAIVRGARRIRRVLRLEVKGATTRPLV
jgi:hypothetical protein